MKRIPCIFLLFVMFAAVTPGVLAQTADMPATIFDALEDPGLNKGKVVINQDPAIRQMVGRRLSGENIEKNDDQVFLKTDGYRTQVFSGNDQRSSKGEAARKEKMVKELFPDIPTYITYTAPFWRLRVGDFRSREEAFQLQRRLSEAFPSFAKEMYIVKDDIKIPL